MEQTPYRSPDGPQLASKSATYRAVAPAFYNLDLAIGKQFHVTERQYFDLRAEFFNALNHANFGAPSRVMSNPASFGAITSTVGTPRNIQLGLKYYF